MTPELAQRIALQLGWYHDSIEGKLPNPELMTRLTKARVYEILRDKTQMNEETIDGFMKFFVMKFTGDEAKVITDSRIKKALESFESNYLKNY